MRRKNYRPGCAAQADFCLIAPLRTSSGGKKVSFFRDKPLLFLRFGACPESGRAKRRSPRAPPASGAGSNRRKERTDNGAPDTAAASSPSGENRRGLSLGRGNARRRGGGKKKGRLSPAQTIERPPKPEPGLTKKSGASRGWLRQERAERKTPARPSAPWAPNFESMRPKSKRRNALKSKR